MPTGRSTLTPNIDKTKPSERGHRVHREGTKEKNMNNLARLNMADFPKFFLGFDRFENNLHQLDNSYPRYNIVKTDGGYRVELACLLYTSDAADE